MRSRGQTLYGKLRTGGSQNVGGSLSTFASYKVYTFPYFGMFPAVGFTEPTSSISSVEAYRTESIQDEPHGKGRNNTCIHEITERGNARYDYARLSASGMTWQLYRNVHTLIPLSTPLAFLSVSEYDKYQMLVRAWRDIQPTFKPGGGVSGFNMLLEAKDIKRLPRQILKCARSLRHTASRMYSHEAQKTLSELVLMNDYAIQPLARDLAVLSTMAGSVGQRLAAFNRQGAQLNTRHYNESRPSIRTTTVVGDFVDIVQKDALFTGSLTCRYREDVANAGGNFLEYYGLTADLGQLWDAIPFSFLVDQVFTVGKTLERLSRTPVSHIDRGDFVVSFKEQTTYVRNLVKDSRSRYFVGGCTSQDISVGSHYPVAWMTKSRYVRHVSIPPALGGVPLPQFKLPSVRNLVDDIALLRSGSGWRKRNKSLFNGPSD